MHCPRCGHQQNSDEISFCTKCGLEIGNVKELLTPELRKTTEKRKEEIKKARRQGTIMIFSSFAFIILFAAVREFFPLPNFIALIALLFMVGGAFRASMPSLFDTNISSKENTDLPENDLKTDKLSGKQIPARSLPEAEYHPPIDFRTKTLDTNDLVAPSSVTEGTTKLLEKELPQD